MIDVHLSKTLNELDETYGGDEMFRLFGPTMLTWAATDSTRMYMFTSNLKQVLTLLEPDVAKLQTGGENSVGKYNNAFKRLLGEWEIKEIIPKFPNIPDNKIITVVFYNKSTDTYEMIESPVAEDLTEKFGYLYNTDRMFSLKEGDKITDEVVFKSTSYDEHMNYRYGKNAKVYYSTSTDTIEDAVCIRRGWADTIKSVEIDTIQIPINGNDVLLNLYGDDKTYKPFPHIGESVKDSLICATRRINNSHLLYDFQSMNLQEVMDTDTDYFTSKDSMIYDVNVFYNGDAAFPNTKFYSHLHGYYEANTTYAERLSTAANKIKKSGSKYTPNVSYFISRYKNYNNPEYKWKNQHKVFGHIILELKVMSIVSLDHGAKVTGRYGNKGVISNIVDTENPLSDIVASAISKKEDLTEAEREIVLREIEKTQVVIVDDERMPYYIRDGERIYADVMLNTSGAIRRLNPEQLIETEVNFIAEELRHKITKMRSIEKKRDTIFKFLSMVSEEESMFFNMLVNEDNDKLRRFIEDVESNGFIIRVPPHKPLLYDDVIALYKEFKDIRPVTIYLDLFGQSQRPMIRKGIIGSQYMLILKQNTNKNFSARSTFRVNRSNLPTKDTAKKNNRSAYARTPVRLSEVHTLLASINSTDLAEHNIFTRSSALGRKSLDRLLSTDGNPLNVKKLKVKSTFTNANADIFAAKLKTLGLRVRYSTIPEGVVRIEDNSKVCPLHFGDIVIYDYPGKRQMYIEIFKELYRGLNESLLIETYSGERYDVILDDIYNRYKDILNITSENIEMLKTLLKSQATDINRIINSSNPRKRIPVDAQNGTPRRRGRKPKVLEVIEDDFDDSDNDKPDIDYSEDQDNDEDSSGIEDLDL